MQQLFQQFHIVQHLYTISRKDEAEGEEFDEKIYSFVKIDYMCENFDLWLCKIEQALCLYEAARAHSAELSSFCYWNSKQLELDFKNEESLSSSYSSLS